MSLDDLTTTAIAVAAAFIIASVVIGMAVRHLLMRQLANRTSEEKNGSRDIVLAGVSKALPPWLAVAGMYAATVSLPLEEGFEEMAGKILVAVAILTTTLAAAGVTEGFVGFYSARHERLPGATSIFSNIAKVVVIVLGSLVTLQTLGVSVGPLVTAMGVGGLAVALALQDTLANLFAGLHVIASRKVVPGDYVLLDSGEEGYVEDINWRNTSLRNLRNNVIVVPNARLASAILTNYYQPAAEMSVLIPVGVSYDSDLESVEKVTTEVGRLVMNEVAGGVPDFEPLIRYHTFDDSSINFNVVLRVKEHTDQYLVRHEFVKRLQRRYRNTGIVIPFPIQTVVSGDDSRVAEDLVRTRASS